MREAAATVLEAEGLEVVAAAAAAAAAVMVEEARAPAGVEREVVAAAAAAGKERATATAATRALEEAMGSAGLVEVVRWVEVGRVVAVTVLEGVETAAEAVLAMARAAMTAAVADAGAA